MIKGRDYFESTEGTGGPVVLVPRHLLQELSLEEAAESPGIEDESGPEEIYGRICEGNEWLRLIPFEDGYILRMGEGPMPVLWMNRPNGALAVQWQGADSEEQLLEFASENASGDAWDEEASFDAGDGRLYLAASTEVIWGEASGALCQVSLPPGQYRVKAKWVENHSNAAIVFQFSRKR